MVTWSGTLCATMVVPETPVARIVTFAAMAGFGAAEPEHPESPAMAQVAISRASKLTRRRRLLPGIAQKRKNVAQRAAAASLLRCGVALAPWLL